VLIKSISLPFPPTSFPANIRSKETQFGGSAIDGNPTDWNA
jgi:hypothetical protein